MRRSRQRNRYLRHRHILHPMARKQDLDPMNPRTCIVSRLERPAEEMIRFVLDPKGEIVPDLNRKLPGRGAWVSLDRTLVEQAVRRNLFARAFTGPVVVSRSLPDLVSDRLSQAVVGALAMANKAGLVVTGFAKVDAAIRNGEAALLLHVRDAAEDGKRKLRSANSATVQLGGPETETFEQLESADMERALGNANIVHVAVKHGGAADSLRRKLVRLNSYNSMPENPATG